MKEYLGVCCGRVRMGRVASVEHPSGVELVLHTGWRLCDATSAVLCESWRYYPIRCDFGPPDLIALRRFVRAVEDHVRAAGAKPLLYYCVYGHPRSISNAVFLLGGYMVLALGATPDQAMRRFEHLQLADYVDVSGSEDFALRVRDCLDGLFRAKRWAARPCGRIDVDRYALYGDVLHGDLHEVVPGRIVALRSRPDEPFDRFLAAKHYARIFRCGSVRAVVQLNEADYDPGAFESAGVRPLRLECEDPWPSEAAIAGFFRIVDASSKVAVHSRGGADHAGTLIALYLMRRHRFTARQALGWLRIVRPGSVVGRHQALLCAAERLPPKAERALWCVLALCVAAACIKFAV